jgi:hypothetical protein
VATDPSTPQMQSLAKNINYGVNLGLVVATIVNVINVVKESVRLISRRLGRVHQATVGW